MLDDARAAGPTIERMPEYSNMFSVLPTHPSQTGRFKPPKHSLPPWADSGASSAASRSRAQSMRANQTNGIQGAHRMLYVNKPMARPSANDSNPLIVHDKARMRRLQRKERERERKLAEQEAAEQAEASVPVREASTQSDFRESEAQTLPYSPDWTVSEQRSRKQRALEQKHNVRQPEVLELQDLEYAHGLPPGQAEVERVERRRERRHWESTLPPLSDPSRFEERRKMMEAREKADWKEREHELEEVGEERIQALEKAMHRDQQELAQSREERIDRARQHRAASARRRFDKIERHRARQLRRMSNGRDASMSLPSYAKPSLGEHLVDPASSKHAPLPRNGAVSISHLPSAAQSYFLPRSLEALERCGRAAGDRAMLEMPQKPQRLEEKSRRTTKDRRKLMHWSDLGSVAELLDASKSKHGQRGIGNCWPQPISGTPRTKSRRKLAAKRSERPTTPKAGTEEHEQPEYKAAVLLQSLLRGRAVQLAMHNGVQRRTDLMQELRYPEAPEPSDDTTIADGANVDAAGYMLAHCLGLQENKDASTA